MAAPSAVVQRLQLRTELRKARAKARLTQQQVATKMDWSPSKLIRIEAGQVGISTNDLRALLREYGITDRRRTETFLELARTSRKLPFSEYRGLLSKPYLDLLSYELAASSVRSFEPLLIPGLLQTEEYMRATRMAYAPNISEERLDRLVEARQQRQEVFDSEQRPEFFFIIDEAAIHRWVGGPGVMKSQLARLKELESRPGITIQVLPFRQGAHFGMLGPFVLLEFDGEMDDILYLENSRGDSVFSDNPEETSRYLERFWALEEQAPGEEFSRIVDLAIDEMGGTAETEPSEEGSEGK